ncbi:MAG TPA: PLP-dependent aminotransferase family protein [Pseudonocardiaceae bacterium]|nr:PLP-dependent aminotransferase family protein [Pseudonocardiaceae bacterium]
MRAASRATLSGAELADLLGRWSVLDGPLYRLLAERIARLADTGELPSGVRLPPERQLAAAISVSRNTATAAYQLLRDEGLAQTRQGAGTTISPHRTTPAAMHRANGFFAGLLESTAVSVDLGVTAVNCAPQVAAALDDPRSVLDAAARRTLTEGNGYHLYGIDRLRAAIADRLTLDHRLPTRPEQIFVTTGAQQAIDLLMRTSVFAGQPVLVEDPTFAGALDALQRAGGRPVGLPVDEGLDPAELGAALRVQRPALVYLILTHQNPTGQVVDALRRQRIAELAAASPETLFVDDTALAELSLTDQAPPTPLAAIAPRLSNVVTIGSVSKTYWAGLRVGWIRAGTELIGRLAAAKAAVDLGGPALPQAITAALLTSEHAGILSWRRAQLRDNLDLLQSGLRTHLPSWSWTRPRGGLSLWVRLAGPTGPCDSGVFSQAALRAGVVVVPDRLLSATHRRRDRLRIAFSESADRLRAAAPLLAQAWQQVADLPA